MKNDELLRKKLLLAMWEGPYFARAVANVISAAAFYFRPITDVWTRIIVVIDNDLKIKST